jgi:Fic family protein
MTTLEAVVSLMRTLPEFTVADVMAASGTSHVAVNRQLRKLLRRGAIVQTGTARGAIPRTFRINPDG